MEKFTQLSNQELMQISGGGLISKVKKLLNKSAVKTTINIVGEIAKSVLK